MNRRIISVLTATAAMGAMFTIGAAPAQAAIKANCNAIFCIAADVYINPGTGTSRVADATVSVRDGLRRNLNIFIASDHWNQANSLRFKKVINKNYKNGTLVCGSAIGATSHACIKL